MWSSPLAGGPYSSDGPTTEPLAPPLNRVRKWRIWEFALVGSVLRDNFHPDSEVDVLVSFQREAERDLFDVVDMQNKLGTIFGT